MPFADFLHHRTVRAAWRTAMRGWFGRRGQRRVHGWRLVTRLRVFLTMQSGGRAARIARPAEARLWVDGTEAFARLAKLIRKAQHTIIVQMFIWKDDATGRAVAADLLAAADRGVKVYITKDRTGDVFELHRDFLTTSKEKGFWGRFWSHRNITIAYTNDNNHAKVYGFDGEVLLITGMNIADAYRTGIRDYMVELRGARFFDRFLTGGELPAGDGSVRLVLNTPLRKEIRPCLDALLAGARKSIVIENPYLADRSLLALLVRRSHEGVRVTLIVPRKTDVHANANRLFLRRLMREGNRAQLRVFLHPDFLHGKLILVDRAAVFVGSANLYTESIDSMGEANVLIEGRNRRAVRKARKVLRQKLRAAAFVKDPPRISLLQRWRAWLWL